MTLHVPKYPAPTILLADMLDALIANNGALLYFQAPGSEIDWAWAIEVGEVLVDGDLYVHPKARKICEGGYSMEARDIDSEYSEKDSHHIRNR